MSHRELLIHRAFTLVEMLVTMIVLALLLKGMVSLSEHVRRASADDATRNLLQGLDHAMDQYIAQFNDGKPPMIRPFSPADTGLASRLPMASEATWTRVAEANDSEVVALLRAYGVLPDSAFDKLSVTYYDGNQARDAWGSPIAFMPREDPAIGMTPRGWFFFSPGPDRQFTTKGDNLYSYDLGTVVGP